MITVYAKVVGSFLSGLGLLGLFFHPLGSVFFHSIPFSSSFFQDDTVVSLVFLSTGIMLMCAGFCRHHWSQTRRTVLLVSAIYALLAINGFMGSSSNLEHRSGDLLYLSLCVSALMFGLPETYAFRQ
jgi:hypothetical protein